jgi:Putative Actinobacterial Holin-X, holin superfamily III
VSTLDRSFADVLQDIVRNIQEIVRSEVRLAKAEISEEARKARPAGVWIAIGAVLGIGAVMIGLLAGVYGLSTVMPNWAAALVVSLASGVIAALAARTGLMHLMRIDPTPDKTIRSLKENVEWSKQQLK